MLGKIAAVAGWIGSCFAVALACGLSFAAEPESSRPVAVVAAASLDRLLGDATFLAREMAGPNAGAATTLLSAWLNGVDRSKPLGVLFYLEERGPRGIGFLPVQDYAGLKKRIEEKLGNAEDTGQQIYRFQVGGQTSVYFRHVDPWVYIADARRHLLNVPPAPATFAGDWMDGATAAFRFDFSALSPGVRRRIDETVSGWLNVLGELPSLPDAAGDPRLQLQQQQLRTVRRFLRDAQTVTLSLRAEPEHDRVSARLRLHFAADSEWVRLLREAKQRQAASGGVLALRHPDAALTFFLRNHLSADDCETWKTSIAIMKQQVATLLSVSDAEGADQQEVLAFADRLFDQFQQTINERDLAVSGTLWLEDDTTRFGVAARVADGPAVEKAFRQFLEKLGDRSGKPQPALDVAQVDGVVMHQLRLDLPDSEKEARLVFGPQLVVTFGFGEKTIYLVLGKESAEWLKQQLSRPQPSQLPEGVVSEIVIALQPLLRNLPEADETKRAQIRRLARLLETDNGRPRDRIHLTVSQTTRSIQYDLEVDAPVFKLLASWGRQSSPRR